MTRRPDDPPADTVTCTITLFPANAEQIVGSNMFVAGAISIGDDVKPNAQGTFTLFGGALFDDNSDTRDVVADDTGQIPAQNFTSAIIGSGSVRLTPTDPAGTPSQKFFAFIKGATPPSVDLRVDRDAAPANGFAEITATATLTRAGLPVTDGNILFELLGMSKARFADDDSGKTSKEVPVDASGQAVARIVDTTPQAGVLRASGTDKYAGAAPATQDIAFTTPPDLKLDLSPREVTFDAAQNGATISIIVTGADKAGVAGATVHLEVKGAGAFFETYMADKITVVTNDEGRASVTVNAYTWSSGPVYGSVTAPPAVGADPETAEDQIRYTSKVPDKLTIGVAAIEYAEDAQQTTWATVKSGGAIGLGGPASLAGRVRISARYMLDDNPWDGYGGMVFAVDGRSHALLMQPLTDPPDPPENAAGGLKGMYNQPPEGAFVPDNSADKGHTPAQMWLQDGYKETVALSITPGAGAESVVSITPKVEFGPAWAGVTKVEVNFVPGGGRVASIYQNGLHQAAIQVVLTLADAFGTVLTEHNYPTADEVLAAVQLVDFTTGGPYSTTEKPARGQFGFVEVGQTSNCFDKQIPEMSGLAPARAAATPEDGQVTFAGGKATIYYYLVFNDQGGARLPGTTVGAVVNPGYPYDGGQIRTFTHAGAADSANTVMISSHGTAEYTLNDLTQSVVRQEGPYETDAGPHVYNGSEAAGNCVRRWDATVSFGNSRFGSDLFGAFLPSSSMLGPDDDHGARSTDGSVFYDIKRGAFQTRAYFWQDNNYLVSDEDYDNDAMDRGVSITAPAKTQDITLDGVETMTRASGLTGKIGMTVAAGFGDLGQSAGTWKPTKFKLVDRYGNVAGEYYLNMNLPQPSVLLSHMDGSGWLPLASAAADSGPGTIAGSAITISRVATTDDEGKDYGNQKTELGLTTTPSSGQSFVGGLPATFINPGTGWTLTPVKDGATLNNEQLYRMSGVFQGATNTITTFNSKDNNDDGYHLVIGVADAGKGDHVQLKPNWANGTVMIFAAKSADASTDGTYWRWSGVTQQKDLFDVMVFGYPYGPQQSLMALWKFDVGGQSRADPPPPGNP